MQLTMRPVQIPADAALVAPFNNMMRNAPMTVEAVIAREAQRPDGLIDSRQLAFDAAGHAVGYLNVGRTPWMREGRFWLRVMVDPAARGQGVGQRLMDEGEAYVRAHGGQRVDAEVRDDDARSLAWVEQRGFVMDRHIFESSLDLSTFDASPFAGVVEQVRGGGIRFFSLANADTQQQASDVYGIFVRCHRDIPGYEHASVFPYAEWHRNVLEGTGFLPDCVIVAADGDRVIGYTNAKLEPAVGTLHTHGTFVDPDYRGRKIALALKLLAIETARQRGVPSMQTNNDAQNAPMLAVNRKLGYTPLPGIYFLHKTLA